MTNGTTKTTWTVTSQSPAQQPDAMGNLISGRNIQYQTNTGYTGSVFVPDSVYADVNAVQALLQADVQQVAAVSALGGSV